MKEKRNENPLGYKSIPKLLAGFAIPSIVAMVVSSLYNIVDQIFIGQGVGYYGNAATTVSFPFTTICMAIALTIGIGTAARYSIYLGQKNEDDAARTVGSGILMMTIAGAVYATIILIFRAPLLRAFGATDNIYSYAMDYATITALGMPFLIVMNGISNITRADGSPIYSMTSMLFGAVINTALDPLFIFVFHLGVSGAAWATVIGQIVSCLYALVYIRRIKRVKLKKEHFVFSLYQLKKTASMGMSNGLTQVSITLLQVVINRSLVHYGELSVYGGDIPLAASGIVMKVNAVILAVIIGIIQGMQPIIGFNYGAANYRRVKKTYNLAVASILVITSIGFICFQFFPMNVLTLFGSGEDEDLYFEFAVKYMRTFLLLIPLTGIQMVSSNLFSAIGKPLKGTILAMTRQVIFLIPLILILPLFFGIDGIMMASPISDIISIITVLIFIISEMRSMTVKEKEKAKK